jgi:hypothetical protein
VASKKAGRKTYPAVIVDLSHDADPALLAQRLKIAANRLNGKPLTVDERVDNAVSLVRAGVPAKAAAEEVGCSYPAVMNALHAQEAIARMVQNSIGHLAGRFSQELLKEAEKIKNNPPFRESLKLAHSTAMTPGDAKALFKALSGMGDQEQQMAYLLAEQTRLQNQALAAQNGTAIKQRKSHAARATTKLSSAMKDFDPKTILGIFSTPAARQQALPDLREQAKVLNDAIRELEKADRHLAAAQS